MAKKKLTAADVAPNPVIALVGTPLFASLVSAGISGTFVQPAEIKPYVDAGLAESRADMADATGAIASRVTEAGMKQWNEFQAATASATPAPFAASTQVVSPASVAPLASVLAPSAFSIRKGVAVPPQKRTGGRGAPVYPFDALEVGDSFFVPATTAKPNPAKSLASTVSSASKRYASERKDAAGAVVNETVTVRGKTITRPQLIYSRVFIVRSTTENGVAGAYVGREK